MGEPVGDGGFGRVGRLAEGSGWNHGVRRTVVGPRGKRAIWSPKYARQGLRPTQRRDSPTRALAYIDMS
jgi:hypothetical protein